MPFHEGLPIWPVTKTTRNLVVHVSGVERVFRLVPPHPEIYLYLN
jgi:hypothetical protein